MAFSIPNTGIHKYRVFNIAIVDVIFTVLFAWIISYYIKYPFWLILLVLFLVGIITHRIFRIRTTIDKMIFPNE